MASQHLLTSLAAAVFLATPALLGAQARPTSTGPIVARPTTTAVAARLDAEAWATRNLQVVRGMAKTGERSVAFGDAEVALAWSVQWNPLFAEEDRYATQMLELAAHLVKRRLNGATPRPARRADGRDVLADAIKLLKMSQPERVIRRAMKQNGEELDGPVVTPDAQGINPLVTGLLNSGQSWRQDTFVLPLLAQMDRVGAEAKAWGSLQNAYERLASQSLQDGNAGRAALFIDRLVALLAAHPEFIDPVRGNTDGVSPGGVVRLLTAAGREADLQKLVAGSPPSMRLDWWIAILGQAVDRGDDARVKRMIDDEIRPVAADVADRLDAAVRLDPVGVIAPVPSLGARAETSGRRDAPPPAVIELGGVQRKLAYRQFDRTGDMDKLFAVTAALQGEHSMLGDGGREDSFALAGLAIRAQQNGHHATADAAFALADQRLVKEAFPSRADAEEKVAFLKELRATGDFVLLGRQYRRAGAITDRDRIALAESLEQSGNAARAAAVRQSVRRKAATGPTIRQAAAKFPGLALDLFREGKLAEAEAMYMRSMDDADDTDFGLANGAAAVRAAMEMGRPQWLDRLYDKRGTDDRLRLCWQAGAWATAAKLGLPMSR